MNPFELQAQFARQWFDLVQTMTATAVAACTSMNEQATALWSRSIPYPAAPTPSPVQPQPFAWPFGAGAMPFTPFAFTSPFMPAANPWQANPFAPWMTVFTGNTAAFPGFSAYQTQPLASALTQFWAPWTAFTPTTGTTMPWMPYAPPSRNPGADLLEQMATNYRTASGYAVAAVIGPLNAALDPRTYGEPWWQRLEKNKTLN